MEKAHITPHQAKYFAYELSKQSPSNSLAKLAASLSDAQVDLNPHQIDAALFAFRSPLSKGAILADEVGLGKTVEAGILLSQKWAERKRKLLVIAPATLRKQWSQELADKFFLQSVILEKRSFGAQVKAGNLNPFEQKAVVICSYQFARAKEAYLQNIPWDLVVIDEAHRLRNVYKPNNRIGNAIKNAISHAPKVLLTATPLQNYLVELYGLVSIIDEFVFGDLKSFREQFSSLHTEEDFAALRTRIKPVCQRTLRRQVLEYVRYTNRIPITQEFFPTDEEQQLYDLVSDYLQREVLYALPASQRKLMTLILRKLLASSTHAISGTLDALASRLEELQSSYSAASEPVDIPTVADGLESAPELEEEWEGDDTDESKPQLSPQQKAELTQELALLREFQKLARSILKNSKGEVLLTALSKGFEKLKELGALQKAVIFTESTRTQEYLRRVLESSQFSGKVVLFNGSNSDPKSKEIYKRWLEKHQGTDRVTGSPTADMRAAIVDYFRDEAIILIATEAAAEGINLQFCSLVVNYDLPWNPQRVEQRIGRCHRYGQKHDVVVVNFLNKKNAADQRVYELLSEKFKLFSGVFGASDDVLGAIESGVEFERRIAEIYQQCRSSSQIEAEFAKLQSDLEEQVTNRLSDTKKKLLENFDEDVQEKLRIGKAQAEAVLSKHESWLWSITRYYLRDFAEFEPGQNAFVLKKNPFPGETIHPGPYRTGRDVQDANIFRVGHPLAQRVIAACRTVGTEPARLHLNLTDSGRRITALESLKGKSGVLQVTHYKTTALESEDYLILAGATSDGHLLDDEILGKLLTLPGKIVGSWDGTLPELILEHTSSRIKSISGEIDTRNASYFEEELDKLDRWADDQRASIRVSIKELDDQIKELKKASRLAPNLPEKLRMEKQRKSLESKRDELWRRFDAEAKRIEEQKDSLIDTIEKRMKRKTECNSLICLNWTLA